MEELDKARAYMRWSFFYLGVWGIGMLSVFASIITQHIVYTVAGIVIWALGVAMCTYYLKKARKMLNICEKNMKP